MSNQHQIEYAVICALGKIRRNNEDNFFCGGAIREKINSNDEVSLSGAVSDDTGALFAVFDGMGGEACGEVASFVAASRTKRFVCDGSQASLDELAELLNDAVRDETEARSLVLMGSTAAIARFSGESADIANAGDSRVYRLRDHELTQLTADHIAAGYGGKAITKFLGLPGDGKLRPYSITEPYKPGDVYLLCSDGVTDMLDDDAIRKIIDAPLPTDSACRVLIDSAMANGGVDNATAILLRVD